MMNAQGILLRLDQALTWASENPAGRPSFRYILLDDWTGMSRIESAADWARIAVNIDEEDYYGEEATALSEPGALNSSNPSLIIFRLSDEEGKREVVAAVRSDCGVDEAMIRNAIGFGMADPSVLERATAVRRASVSSSESTRHAGRERYSQQ